MTLKRGDKAPAFSLPDQDGKVHKLGDYEGKWILLYFYPKDNTSGCTKEACAIRDEFPRFGGLDALVFGVSKDSVESHKRFAEKQGLPFTLLSDAETEVQKKYGGERVHGDPPHVLSHRSRWKDRQGLREGQAGRARRGGSRGSRIAEIENVPT